MADDQKSSRTQITVALICVLGALLVAIISNSDKIFPPSGPPKFVPSAAEDKRTETTALPARQGTIPQSKSGPAIAVKEPPKPTSLSSPQPTAPLCGSTIPIDRPLIFAWARVNGASTYSVEVDCFGCTGRSWYSVGGSPWHVREGLGLRTPIYSSNLQVRLRQEGGRAVRWRVWAVDHDGQPGAKSIWCQTAFSSGRR